VSCEICQVRKEKRFCPAVHGRICAQCCGEQREVTLDCPGDCPYLQQAREHEKARPAAEIEPAALLPEVEIPDAFLYEQEQLILGLSFALAKRAHADRALRDQGLIAATTALARRYLRLVESGLHYEEPVTSPALQDVIAELETMVKDYREAEEKHRGYSTLRDSDVLKGLVFLVRMGHARTSGRPLSRAFVDFLFTQFPESPAVLSSDQGTGSRLIVP
jgi:hypothetical protein